MKKQELINLLKTKIDVFGWVNLYVEDGQYVNLVKKDVIFWIKNATESDEINAVVRDGAIYIN